MSTTPPTTLESQLPAFQAEVRSLFAELGAEIRTEQVRQGMKLDEMMGRLALGQVALYRLQEAVSALGRGFTLLRHKLGGMGEGAGGV